MVSVVHMGFFRAVPIGIARQLEYEHGAARRLGLDWTVRFFSCDEADRTQWCEAQAISSRTEYYLARRRFYQSVRAEAATYDLVLLRYLSGDPGHYLGTRTLSNIVSCHHAFEIEQIRLRGGWTAGARALVERTLGMRSIRNARAVVADSPTIVDYELARIGVAKQSYAYLNGVDVERFASVADDRRDVPTIVFLSSWFQPWQGLDLLLDSLDRYPSVGCRLILGGELPQELGERALRDGRVELRGLLGESAIRELLATADVGLGPLALERKGMSSTTPLKVREYLAGGVPVYMGHKDDAFPPDYSHVRVGRVDLQEIVDFALASRKVPRAEIRESARPFIDTALLLGEFHRWLSGLAAARE